MKTIVLAASILACSVAAASSGSNFYGFTKAEVVQVEGAPVTIQHGMFTGVQDSSSTNSTMGVLLGPPGVGQGAYQSGSCRYDVAMKAMKAGIVAIEVEWESVNAFGEVQGARKASFSWKNEMHAGSTRQKQETAERIGGGSSTYRIHVTRVKFATGEIWSAPDEDLKLATDQPVTPEPTAP